MWRQLPVCASSAHNPKRCVVIPRAAFRAAPFYEPFRPQDGDIIASRHRSFDSFYGDRSGCPTQKAWNRKGDLGRSDIPDVRRRHRKAGYHLTFLKDAVAEFTYEAHEAAVGISYPTFGHQVLTVDEFLSAICKPAG